MVLVRRDTRVRRNHKGQRIRGVLTIVISLFMLLLVCSLSFVLIVDSNNATIDLSMNVLDGNVSMTHDHDEKSRVHGNGHVNENGSSGDTTEIERTNGQIISTVKTKFDLNFVDLAGKSKNNEHPHKGALDENGNPGYIYDEKALHTSKTHCFQHLKSHRNKHDAI